MGALFIPPENDPVQHEQIMINGRVFDAEIKCKATGHRARSIQGGRIVFFLMSEASGVNGMEDVAVSCYENGKWTLKCPEEDDEACIAQTYFISHWNYDKKKQEK
jgi:hypothetical protein